MVLNASDLFMPNIRLKRAWLKRILSIHIDTLGAFKYKGYFVDCDSMQNFEEYGLYIYCAAEGGIRTVKKRYFMFTVKDKKVVILQETNSNDWAEALEKSAYAFLMSAERTKYLKRINSAKSRKFI